MRALSLYVRPSRKAKMMEGNGAMLASNARAREAKVPLYHRFTTETLTHVHGALYSFTRLFE